METQRAEIQRRLAIQGWSIVEVEDQALEWWGDEIWLLESVWSPVGAHAYVTFLIDPQSSTRNRRKGQGVWAVKASAVRPVDWLTGAGEYTLSLGQGWEEESPGFFEHLARLRNQESAGAR